jgi:hypothetical protein
MICFPRAVHHEGGAEHRSARVTEGFRSPSTDRSG